MRGDLGDSNDIIFLKENKNTKYSIPKSYKKIPSFRYKKGEVE
jgi:hypothetical protein